MKLSHSSTAQQQHCGHYIRARWLFHHESKWSSLSGNTSIPPSLITLPSGDTINQLQIEILILPYSLFLLFDFFYFLFCLILFVSYLRLLIPGEMNDQMICTHNFTLLLLLYTPHSRIYSRLTQHIHGGLHTSLCDAIPSTTESGSDRRRPFSIFSRALPTTSKKRLRWDLKKVIYTAAVGPGRLMRIVIFRHPISSFLSIGYILDCCRSPCSYIAPYSNCWCVVDFSPGATVLLLYTL